MNVYQYSPAFPNSYIEENGVNVSRDGIDVRTYIATKALLGILASCAGEGVALPNRNDAAELAVEYADALINKLNESK